MARPKNLTLKEKGANSFTSQVERHLNKTGDFGIEVQKHLTAKKKDWEWIILQTGFSRSAVRNWLNGHKTPAVDSVLKIGFLLDLTDKQKRIMLKTIPFNLSKNSQLLFKFVEKYNETKADWKEEKWEQWGLNYYTMRHIFLDGTIPNKANFEKIANFCIEKGIITDKLQLIDLSISPEFYH